MTSIDPRSLVGREPERLSIPEHAALTGKWIALEIYSPQTLPLRRIEAVGDSVGDCAAHLRSRGLDPRNFEFSLVKPPY
ncbi:MAG: hypothetical protein KIT09_33835 [Bryobacteraceae bacterium]|nr:hypothetical protein [Bryobacteraceae bacterium]